MHFLRENLAYFKYVLPLVAIAVIVICAVIRQRRARYLRAVLAAILLIAAILAGYDYTWYFWGMGHFFNAYEFYHYYLGSKYAGEVGYTDLYRATLVADYETGYRPKNRTIRDLKTHRFVRAERVLKEKEKIKGLFSDERWDEFTGDVVFFRKKVSAGLWKRMLRDKGYNATPVWTTISGCLSNQVSTDNMRGMISLALLDVALILAALACVWWAFDHRIALLMAIFFGSHYLVSQHYTLRAAFLRLDWVMCLVMVVCMLKKERYRVAGALTAYASMARVFPLVFAFGMGIKAVVDFVSTRSVNRRYLAYWASFAVTAAILVGASLFYVGRLDAWGDFFAKIGQHNKDISGWRVGFKYVFLMSYDGSAFWGRNLAEFFEDWKLVWWTIQAVVILLSAFLVLRLDDYEAVAYGYVLVFFLVAPTYYYHVMLVVPFLFFAGKMGRPMRAVGLIMMFATSMIAYKLYLMWDRGYKLYFTISCMLLVNVLYMMVVSFKATAHPQVNGEPVEGAVKGAASSRSEAR